MAKTTSKSGSDSAAIVQPEFVLKHRIAGAAFLLFFGALVLPWVLGAPGEPPAAMSQSSSFDETADDALGNDELSRALIAEQAQIEEQVYISRITPLDAQGGTETQKVDTKPTPSEAQTSVTSSQPKATTSKPNKPVAAKQQPKKTETKPVAVQANSANKATSEADKSANKPAPAKQTAKVDKPTADESSIDVGWVVQVGVFTDKRGAGRVVADLRDKGFSPSTTVVDTNRGKNTGTRIWLGPFAQRVEAAKAKSELTQKTGEAGFIRAFP